MGLTVHSGRSTCWVSPFVQFRFPDVCFSVVLYIGCRWVAASTRFTVHKVSVQVLVSTCMYIYIYVYFFSPPAR